MVNKTNMTFEDLKVGMHVTITKHIRKKNKNQMNPLKETETKMVKDKSYQGDVLKVECLEYPFVIFRNLTENPESPGNSTIQLDMRKEIEFMRLSDKYINLNKHPSRKEV